MYLSKEVMRMSKHSCFRDKSINYISIENCTPVILTYSHLMYLTKNMSIEY